MEPLLLILDLDETLMWATEVPMERAPDFTIGPFFCYKRPYVGEFLGYCLSSFKVAVWSSSTYAYEAVQALFPPANRLEFVFDRRRCTRVMNPETREESFVKDLRKLRRRGYELQRVLAIDDTPAAWSRSYGNLIRVRPYLGAAEDDELQLLMAYLGGLKDTPDVRAVEKRNWAVQMPMREAGT
jgi:TFIIF-interacting CTD phosphatase-like protein